MGLGLQTESSGGGNFLPIIKFDARAGRVFRSDRSQGSDGMYSTTPTDITRSFKAVMDMENVEVGYINFATGGAPSFVLVPLGDPMPQNPGEGYKQGFRIELKLHADCGGDVREFSSCAKVVLKGFDLLHDAYVAGEKENPGKLPVVVLKDTIAVTSEGKQKSTNYQPVFEIVGWTARPRDWTHTPRAKVVQTNPAPAKAPPATGSTQVSAPAAKQPAMADADDGGFG